MANPLLNVTDYSKKWVEGYQRNTQQLARYHDQLTLRDQQEEKAKTAVTTPKVLAQIDQTLGSTLQFATARDELKRDKIFQKLDKLGVDGDATSLLMLMDKHGKDIVNQEKDYNKYLDSLTPQDREAMSFEDWQASQRAQKSSKKKTDEEKQG